VTPRTRTSTNTKFSASGFHHIALRARDFDKSLAFYRDGLGFPVAHAWGEGAGRIALLDLGDGNYIELFASKPGQVPEPGSEAATAYPFFHLALRSKDVDRDIETVRALGCPITVEPKSVPIGGDPLVTIRVGFFLGPDDEVLEFFCHQNDPNQPQL
jgi:glyoxylase I family protein